MTTPKDAVAVLREMVEEWEGELRCSDHSPEAPTQLAALRHAIQACERYAWLRDKAVNTSGLAPICVLMSDTTIRTTLGEIDLDNAVDIAIDAAARKEQQK